MSRTSHDSRKKNSLDSSPFDEVKRLYTAISKRIIGQEDAKRVVSMAVALHLDRIANPTSITKSNVLLYGPTGSGKTEIARAIAEEVSCPFLIVDCSKITPSGFIGEDASSFLSDLFELSNQDASKAEKAIVFLDEIDKLCSPTSSHEGSFQVRKVMAELLKLIEGQKVSFKKKANLPGFSQEIVIDTTNILFIAAGAFSGLEDMLSNSTKKKTLGIHGGESPADSSKPATQAEFVNALFQYGMMPELAGRFQLMASTKKLSKSDYVDIITSDKYSHTTNYYTQLLMREKTKLKMSAELVEEMAANAYTLGLGARGVQGLIESRMVELVFDIESIRGKSVTLERDGYTIDGLAKSERKSSAGALAILQKQSILSDLDNVSLAQFCDAGTVKDYAIGERIMTEGEKPSSVMILMQGALRATNQAGLNVVRNQIGSCFGEISFLDGKPRTATLTAEVDSRVLEFTSSELSRLIKTRPDLGVRVLQAFSKVAFERVKA